MKIGIKQEKWLKALESGRYKQCKGYLMNEKGHCCLGVAAKTMRVPLDPDGFGFNFGGDDTDEDYILLNHKDIGLKSPSGHIRRRIRTFKESSKYFKGIALNRCGSLATLNDAGATFKQVARFIRENPDRVFNKSV